MAAHYALEDPRVEGVGLMSPVSNLSLLEEFDGAGGQNNGSDALRPLDLAANAAALALRNVWTVIGDEDRRVYTDSAVQFMRSLQCSGCSTVGRWGCSGCPASHGDNQLRNLFTTIMHKSIHLNSRNLEEIYHLLAK
jgi:hypothetical protein